MKALVKNKKDKGAELENVKSPSPKSKEVLVKIKAAAICGTDIHIMDWSKYAQERVNPPMIFGHEFSGEIVEVGKDVNCLEVGDLVAGETHLPCGECRYCLTGNMHICSDMKILGVHIPGIFSEYAVVPEVLCWKLPEGVSPEEGVLWEPGGVALHAVMEADTRASTTLIIGCGPIGLMAIGLAKNCGANKVIAIGKHEERRELARKIGADSVFSLENKDSIEEEPEVVIEISGSIQGIKDAFSFVRKSGEIILVGLPSDEIGINMTDEIIYKETNVKGITGRLMWDTWVQMEDLFKAGKFSPKHLITAEFGLEDYEKAFEVAGSSTQGKVVFYP